MKVYWISPQSILPAAARGGVLMMGNFDGFHKGHMLLVSKAKDLCSQIDACLSNQKKVPINLLTFYPHPEVLFSPHKSCFFITSLRAKLRLAAELKIENVYLCKFTPDLARMSAKQFIDIFLSNMIAPLSIVVGEDFRFGKNKKGTPKTLQRRGFDLNIIPRNIQYSSSRARAFIEAGDMIGATNILGRPYEIEGYVKKGYKEARKLGYPTINIAIDHFIRPALGVYATQVFLDGRWHNSLSYFGRRKVVKEPILETHIFDCNKDLYHKRLRVRFIDFIRKPKKFNNAFDLKHQLITDTVLAKNKLDHMSSTI